MRSFLFGLKLALVLALILGSALGGAFFVFLHLAGHELMEVFIRVNAYEGIEVVEILESRLAAREAEGRWRQDWYQESWVADLLATNRRRLGLRMGIEPGALVGDEASGFGRHRPRRQHSAEVAGRWCEVTNLPLFRVHIPIERRGETVARLVVGGSDHAFAVHDAFRRGLTLIAIAGLIAVVVLTVGFTVPLRRMRRSMDRIAEGDLDHRVMVRGGDEVAAMGHSFNAMAARIGSVLTGQKELLAGVSHELRSPLARMAVLTELLRDKAPADRIDDLEAEIDVIDGLVGELLLASRFDLGAEPMDLGNHTLAGLIEEAWSRVGVQLDFSGLRLIQNLDRESTTVRVDRALAVRILRNLFQNAARYVKRGTVTVTAQRRGDRVEITVADDGPGVRREQLERLFEPFYRGDAARSRGTDAVGLGLMIVRRAVEAHGGTVQARVGAAGGLAVGFDLPAA